MTAQTEPLAALVARCGGELYQCCRRPSPASPLVASLLGCCWPLVTERMPLAALVTKFGGEPPAGMAQADVGATTRSATLAIKFSGGRPTVRPLADGGADDVVGGPCHQVWRSTPLRNVPDRGSLSGRCRPAAMHILL